MFKGNNKELKTKKLIDERIKYKLNSFDSEKNVTDFNFSDYVYYGKCDQNYNSIVINEESLTELPETTDPTKRIVALDFVVDAWRAFIRKIDQAKLMNKISPESFMYSLAVYKAYEDPIDLYNNFANNYFKKFNNLVDPTKIKKFDDWVSEFYKWHQKNGPNFPITLSGFQRSKHSSIFTSGLALSLSGEPADDDSIKEQLILNDKQKQFYINTALQYGFIVNQNVPWILVADLNSPAMLLYSKEYNLSSSNSVFLKKYSVCYEKDLEYLQEVLKHNWNQYVKKYNKVIIVDTKCEKTRIKKYHNYNIINNNKIYYILNYINIRNTEEYSRYTKAELDRIKQKAIFFYKKLDKSKAISYINEQFRLLTIKRPGTLNHVTNINRRKNDISNK